MDEKERVFIEAERHEGRYLIPRRPYYSRHAVPPPPDPEYAACEALVQSGHAMWLTGNLAPGIRLSGKPLDAR